MLVHVQLDGAERTLSLPEFEDLVRAGRVGRETPVRGEALTAGRWVAAGTLATFQGLDQAPDALLRRAWDRPAIPWATALIVGICVRVHAWASQGPLGGMALADRSAKWTPAILEHGEGWRLLTYSFFHGDLGHLASNMVFLAYMGVALEGLLGWRNLAVIYAVSVFSGAAVSAVLTDTPSIGASGGDFGFLAAAVAVGWRYTEIIPRRARLRFNFVMFLWLVYLLGSGLLQGDKGVDNFAHVGGAIGGALAAVVLKPDLVPAWRRANRAWRALLIGLVVVGTLGAGHLPVPTEPFAADGLSTTRPAGWEPAWTGAGESGFGSPLGDARFAASTRKADGLPDAAADAAALLDRYRAADPALAVLRDDPVTRGVATGRRLAFTTKDDAGRPRRVEALLLGRGLYRHLVLLEWGPESRVGDLAERVVDGVEVGPLKAERDAEDLGDTPRGKAARARVLAEVGRADEARALLDAARRDAPDDPVPTQTALELAPLLAPADAPALAESALVTFPGDRKVLMAAVRALHAAGRSDRARAVLDAALAEAPGDRKLEKLSKELE